MAAVVFVVVGSATCVSTVAPLRRAQVAVNTFRDVVHVGVFLGTSALLVVFGLLGYAFSEGAGGCPPHALGRGACAPVAAFLTARILVLAADFAAVFFNFSMGVRYLNNTSYIINAGTLHGRPVEPELVIAFQRRAYRYARWRGRMCVRSHSISLWAQVLGYWYVDGFGHFHKLDLI